MNKKTIPVQTKEFCRKGHPLSPDNVYYNPGKPSPLCKKCRKQKYNKWYMSTKAGTKDGILSEEAKKYIYEQTKDVKDKVSAYPKRRIKNARLSQ